MLKKKLSLTAKVLISAGIIVGGSTAAIGGVFLHSYLSDEVNGSNSNLSKEDLKNDYSKIYDENRNLKPILAIKDPLKKKDVAFLNENGTEFWFKENPKEKYDFDTFFKKYYQKYEESFILEVKYGSFSFYDEYVLAVQPEQFIEFTKWFFKNVSWGPDLVTLESFRLVPGVEQNGNAITLGSHTTLNKEVSEIKFFPDAFFGSMPLYSELSGSGNASDSLAYLAFRNLENKKTVDTFLQSIPLASAIKNSIAHNANDNAFLSLNIPSKLKDKEFLAYINREEGENGRGTLLFDKNISEQQFKELLKKHSLEKENIAFSALEKVQISTISSELNDSNPILALGLKVLNSSKNEVVNFRMSEGEISNKWLLTYQLLKETIDSQIVHFLDFYDIKAYENKKLYKFTNAGKTFFYKNKIEALNNNDALKNYASLSDEIKNNLKEYTVKKLEVIDAKLHVTLSNNNQDETIIYESKNMSDAAHEQFIEFKEAIGYQGSINPITISYGPENLGLKDENGKDLKGMDSRNYQVYYETYNGLIEKVTKKYPHLLKRQFGPHIQKKLNEKGYYEYSLTDGEYYGLQHTDRIGLPLVLGATIENFKGISIDFLKYVTAHEYGHHFTLEQNQALNNNENALIVGGLSTRGGINISSYYSYKGLENYLLARTNLSIERVNALGKPSAKGEYVRFKYLQKDGVEHLETDDEIWGDANPKASIFEVAKNTKRRFLQTFEGLMEAAKERKVDLKDLFLANSFDENSGTLNPFITGNTKAFAKKETDVNGTKKQVYKLEEISLKNILSELKDGKGKKLSEIVTLNAAETDFTLEVVKLEEVKENNQTITYAREIKMFNNDGSPVINVPLNEPLDKATLDFITAKTQEIKTAIENAVIRRFSQSGWNDLSSSLGGVVSPNLRNVLNAYDTDNIANNIINRSANDELNPEYNVVTAENNPRKAKEYFALNSSDSLANQIKDTLKGAKAFVDLINSNRGYEGQLTNVLSFVTKNGDNYSSDVRFTFPNVARAESRFLTSVYTSNIESNLKNALERFELNLEGKLQVNPLMVFAREGTRILGSTNILQSADFIFINDQNKVSDHVAINNAFTKNNDAELAKLITKIGFNTKDNIFDDKRNGISLYEAFNSSLEKLNISTTATEYNTVVFNNFKNFFEFASLDYSKATLVSVTKDVATGKESAVFNWNIDYVKTKFDLNKFKEELLKSSAESAKTKEMIQNGDDQVIANEMMFRFRKSHYFLAIKDFNPLTELEQNKAIFSEKYGISFLSSSFKTGLVYDLSKYSKDEQYIKYDANKLQTILKEYVTKILGKQENIDQILANVNSQDLYLLVGNIITWNNNGLINQITLGDVIFNEFNSGQPSSDVLNYNLSRVEASIGDKFTDYIYNIAETLTRDYVQTTYVPSFKDFGNLPGYLSNLNEATTGLDYIVDATKLKIWNDRKNNFNNSSSSITQAGRSLKFEEYLPKTKDTYVEISNQIDRLKDLAKSFVEQILIIATTYTGDKEEEGKKLIEKLREQINKINEQNSDLTNKRFKKVIDIKNKVYGSYISRTTFSPRNEDRTSSYFGRFITRNNGYFKDTVEKEKIGLELYDENRNEIVDDSIRLKDFDGNKINTRAKAFFVSQILNYGVGSRNISGLFRNKEKDAVVLYGFVKNEKANKIKKIRFTDVITKEIKYLDVNFKDTNNLFYLSKQGDESSKVTLADLGYSSWVSDYAIMAKYRDTLLKPKHKYFVEFVDENNEFVEELSLGDLEVISENGKTDTQSSIKIYKDKTKENKAIIDIDFQFNITG
ncbi:PDxFFG protein [Mycoplasma sp. 5370]